MAHREACLGVGPTGSGQETGRETWGTGRTGTVAEAGGAGTRAGAEEAGTTRGAEAGIVVGAVLLGRHMARQNSEWKDRELVLKSNVTSCCFIQGMSRTRSY